MSRRRRKKTNPQIEERVASGSRFKGIWWKSFLGLLVLVIVGVLFAYSRVVAFLHSDGFRDGISLEVCDELGTEGGFGDFEWDGLSAKNESFESVGIGAISSIKARGLAMDVELDFFKRDKFTLKNVYVGAVDAELDIRREFLKVEREKQEKGFLESLLPEEVELLDAELGELNAVVHSDSGKYEISGVNLRAQKDGDSYNALLKGGMVNLPFAFLSSANLVNGELSQLDEEIYITDTRLKIFGSGEVVLNGVVDLSPRARQLYDLKVKLSGLSCKDVFPKEWHSHLKGEVRGGLRIRPHEGTEPKVSGSLDILNGTLEALPVLSKISYYLAEPRFRTLEFEKFTCNFEKFRDGYELKQIVLSSGGLLKIEGDLKIEGESLNGLFDVGVPASFLSKIPGAKTSVFKPGRDQLLWAKVRIGGDFDNITEDLSDRLIHAATEEMIKRALSMGSEVLNPESIDNLIEGGEGIKENIDEIFKGDKGLIDGGLDAAKGLLDGITGSNKKEGDEDDGEKRGGGILPKLPVPDLPKIPGLPFL